MADLSHSPTVGYEEKDLVELSQHVGPFLTVSLPTPAGDGVQTQQNDLIWRSHRTKLQEVGAPSELLDTIGDLFHASHALHFYCATSPTATHVEHLPVPLASRVLYNDLPVLTPLLAYRQTLLPHLRVAVDRKSAVIHCFDHTGGHVCEVIPTPDDDVIHPVATGSQRHGGARTDTRARDSWMHHAKTVAEAIDTKATHIGARLIIMTGDLQEVNLTKGYLTCSTPITEVRGSRANDGSALFNADDVAAALEAVKRQDDADIISRLEDPAQGVVGPRPTIKALSMGRVELLLVSELSNDQRSIWFGEEPTQIALSEDHLRAMGTYRPKVGRLLDVCISSALRTSAQVRVMDPADLPTGVAAILRW